jgi:multicomponent Na+:H+ antiporter subunit C
MDFLQEIIIARANYWAYVVLMMIGLYAIIAKQNLIKKIVGLSILQTAVILFYISIGTKRNATIPIIAHGHDAVHATVTATDYMNPLPHVLMLTAIVVAVATFGVALAVVIKLYEQYGTLEENEILKKISETASRRT